jgi:hypothetical protein
MKYIIDIEDTPVNGLYKAKGFRTLVFDEFGLSKLEKYSEEDLLTVLNKMFDDGAAMAWKTAQKIAKLPGDGGLTSQQLMEIFGTSMIPLIFDGHSPQEAYDLILKYLAELPAELVPGDEVTAENGRTRFVVTRVGKHIRGIDEQGNVYFYLPEEIDGKTGRHFYVNITPDEAHFA